MLMDTNPVIITVVRGGKSGEICHGNSYNPTTGYFVLFMKAKWKSFLNPQLQTARHYVTDLRWRS